MRVIKHQCKITRYIFNSVRVIEAARSHQVNHADVKGFFNIACHPLLPILKKKTSVDLFKTWLATRYTSWDAEYKSCYTVTLDVTLSEGR